MTLSSPAERLTRIQVSAFRGVPRTFDLALVSGRSVAVFGDNGTGKSTIADAIEWFFTGKIGFLSHEGRGHAIRNLGGSEPTWVEIATTGILGGRTTHPHDGKGPALAVGAEEMFQLRGRALAEFIDKTKGEKWKELANVLGFETVNQLSLELQRVRNDLEAARLLADSKVRTAAAALAQHGISADETSILAYIRRECERIDVKPPSDFEAAMDPSWAPSLTPDREAALAVGRCAALADGLAALNAPKLDPNLVSAWNDLIAGETNRDRSRRELIRAADAYLTNAGDMAQCPLCRQAVDSKTLHVLVAQTLGDLEAADRRFRQAEEGLMALVAGAKAAETIRAGHVDRAEHLGIGALPEMPTPLSPELERARSERSALATTVIDRYLSETSSWDAAAAEATKRYLDIGGDDKGKTLSNIVIAAEQSRQWVISRSAAVAAHRARDVSQRIFDTYQDRLRAYFSGVLKQITGRTSEIYGRLHPNENLEDVRIEPWEEKGVELAIQFYGTQQRPPHGVLSESHLNSLAIALFLAMAEAFNQKVGFLVLDDVVNSFDAEHRGRLAELLVTEFKSRQLIVLTHDPLFYKRLVTLAPDWSRLEFTSWSFEDGPRAVQYAGSALLGAARERVSGGDRHGAATKARRALEDLLQEICERLEADLPFRRGAKNDHREYGEVMTGVRGMLKKRSPKLRAELEPLLKQLDADVQAGLNVESHASQQQASQSEIADAIERIGDLERAFTCASCNTRVWSRGSPDSCRCRCGATVFPPLPSPVQGLGG